MSVYWIKAIVNDDNWPCCGLPFCARIRVQCSDMFIITSGCNETVTEGTVAGLAITLFDGSLLGFIVTDGFDVEGVAFVAELLVEASPMLLSLSTSIFSFVAVTGIFYHEFTRNDLLKFDRFTANYQAKCTHEMSACKICPKKNWLLL